jgi:hypothetical protein
MSVAARLAIQDRKDVVTPRYLFLALLLERPVFRQRLQRFESGGEFCRSVGLDDFMSNVELQGSVNQIPFAPCFREALVSMTEVGDSEVVVEFVRRLLVEPECRSLLEPSGLTPAELLGCLAETL